MTHIFLISQKYWHNIWCISEQVHFAWFSMTKFVKFYSCNSISNNSVNSVNEYMDGDEEESVPPEPKDEKEVLLEEVIREN